MRGDIMRSKIEEKKKTRAAREENMSIMRERSSNIERTNARGDRTAACPPPTSTLPPRRTTLTTPSHAYNHRDHHHPAALVVEGEVLENFVFPGTLPSS